MMKIYILHSYNTTFYRADSTLLIHYAIEMAAKQRGITEKNVFHVYHILKDLR